MRLHTVTLSLGSNCGERSETLERAITVLSLILSDTVWSEIYETPTISSHPDDSDLHADKFPTYLNAVVEGKTGLSAEVLDEIVKDMEVEFGRDVNARKRGEVPLDVDIVMYDGKVLRPRDFSQSFFRIGFISLHPGHSGMQ